MVKPPQMPTITNCRASGATIMRPSGPLSTANIPITNDPMMFTARVPQGKVSPTQKLNTRDTP